MPLFSRIDSSLLDVNFGLSAPDRVGLGKSSSCTCRRDYRSSAKLRSRTSAFLGVLPVESRTILTGCPPEASHTSR